MAIELKVKVKIVPYPIKWSTYPLKCRAEVWSDTPDQWLFNKDAIDTDDEMVQFDEPLPEDSYVVMNAWCLDTLGYHARTAYHVFDFKTEQDLLMFKLKWE